LICRSIYNREGGIYQYSQITTANLDENLSGCECQSDSTIQGASRGTEKRRRKTKLIKIEGVKEWEIEKILNKKKIRGVEKYLV